MMNFRGPLAHGPSFASSSSMARAAVRAAAPELDRKDKTGFAVSDQFAHGSGRGTIGATPMAMVFSRTLGMPSAGTAGPRNRRPV